MIDSILEDPMPPKLLVAIGIAGLTGFVRSVTHRPMKHEYDQTTPGDALTTTQLPFSPCIDATTREGHRMPLQVLPYDAAAIATRYATELNVPVLRDALQRFLVATTDIADLSAIAVAVRRTPRVPDRLSLYALTSEPAFHNGAAVQDGPQAATHRAYRTLDRTLREQHAGISCGLTFLQVDGNDPRTYLPRIAQQVPAEPFLHGLTPRETLACLTVATISWSGRG